MTETSIAQINDRIAHLRLVYGDADQDAALLEALLKEREEAKEGWHVVMPNLDQIGKAAAVNGGIDTSTEAVEKLLDADRKIYPNVDKTKLTDGEIDILFRAVGACAAYYQAKFAVAARDLVPALLAERDALKKERDEAIEGWHVIHPNITVQDAAKVVADGLADGEVWRVAVNGAAVILNSGMPEEYWTPVKQIREALHAALRAIAEGSNAKAD